MKKFEVTLKIPLTVDDLFEKFLEIAAGQEYDQLQKELYNAVASKLIKKSAATSKLTVEKRGEEELIVTSDRRLYYERTAYDLKTKDFTWKMVVRGMEKIVDISSTGTMKTEQDHSIYFEATTFNIGIPVAGPVIESAIVAAARNDVQSKKKFYEKTLAVPIEIISAG